MKKLKREDLQALAKIRLSEARLLLEGGSWPGAYHLTGLAIECGLKACIARSTEEFEFPALKHVQDSWNHDLSKLLNTAGLQEQLTKNNIKDKQFEANWLTIKDWNIDSRYEMKTQREAQDIYTASTEKDHGVMAWIEESW